MSQAQKGIQSEDAPNKQHKYRISNAARAAWVKLKTIWHLIRGTFYKTVVAPWRAWKWLLIKPERLTALSTLAIFLATAVAVAVASLQWLALRSTDDKVYKQILLANPPLILITNVAINPDESFKPKTSIKATAWLVNAGKSTAKITEIKCIWVWLNKPLPMIRPYDQAGNGIQIKCEKPIKRRGDKQTNDVLESGDFGNWEQTIAVPDVVNEKMSFYFMGEITYIEPATKARRVTLFARKYDPTIHRFVAEKDNPDYEGNE